MKAYVTRCGGEGAWRGCVGPHICMLPAPAMVKRHATVNTLRAITKFSA